MLTTPQVREQFFAHKQEQNLNLTDEQMEAVWSLWIEETPSTEDDNYTDYDKNILLQVIEKFATELESNLDKAREYIATRKANQSKNSKSKKRNKNICFLKKQYNLDFRTIADILEVAGLPEADSYTNQQVEIFDKAYKEFTNQKEKLESKTQERIAKLLARRASKQGEEVASAISGVTTSLRQEVERQFIDLTYETLLELSESGELDEMIDAKVVQSNQQSALKKKRFLPDHLFTKELMMEARTEPLAVIEAATDSESDNEQTEAEMEEEV